MTKKKNHAEEEMRNNASAEKPEDQSINSQNNETGNTPDIENRGTGEDATDGTPPVTGSDKQADALRATEEKLAEMQDRYIRLSAEFDNYRKRTLREKIELTKHAGEDILISIVPVLDDFERALNSIDGTSDCTSIKNGIDLIYNKFRDVLSQKGLKEIEAQNLAFNVDLHEAVSKISVEDENMKGKVVNVLLKGYFLHDKVMRFSKVVVGE
jgi:molecular chaperone GrpE